MTPTAHVGSKSCPAGPGTFAPTAWEDGFNRLLDYVERHGDARVPQSYTIDGYKLGQWVTSQRSFHSRGFLDADRQRRLQELPGWTWDPFGDQWDEGFRRLLDYVEHHGHARVPQSSTIDGYRLGGWVNTQRVNRNEGNFAAERERRLEDLPGWTWDARAGQTSAAAATR